MTVSAITPDISYAEDGVTLVFPVPFGFRSATDLIVARIQAGVETVLTSAYSVSGMSNGTGGYGSGDVTLAASVSGATLRIRRQTPLTQPANYTPGDAFRAETFEGSLDRNVMQTQEVDARVAALDGRSVKVPEGELGPELPAAAVRAGKYLAFDAASRPIASDGTGADLGLRTDLAAPSGSSLISTIQSGTGAFARPVESKLNDFLNLADFLPYNYSTNGSQTFTSEVQKAFDEAIGSGSALSVPAGVFAVDGDGIAVAPAWDEQLVVIGCGGLNSVFRNPEGSVLRVQGQYIHFYEMGLQTLAGGHVVRQSALFARSKFDSCYIDQQDPDYSVFDNDGHEFVGNHFLGNTMDMAAGAHVHGVNLVAPGGVINNNRFNGNWINRSGGKHFFNLESTTANAQYAVRFEDNIFEVCIGGGIRLKGVNGFLIDNCHNWDADPTGPIINHFFEMEAVLGIGCVGQVLNCGRWAGFMASGKYDVKLPGGGAGAGVQVHNCRSTGGGSPFTVDAANNGIVFSGLLPGVFDVINNAGLCGIDPSQGLMLGGKRVLAARGAAIPDVPLAAAPPTMAEYNGFVTSFNALLNRFRVTSGHGAIED